MLLHMDRYKEKEIISSDDESLASFSKANPCANDKPFPQTMDGYAFTAFHGYKVVFGDKSSKNINIDRIFLLSSIDMFHE